MKETALEPKQLFIVLVTMLTAAVGPFASDLYLPSLPHISQSFHVGASLIQYTIASYFLGLALSPLVYGPLSDRIGRRKVLICGLSIALMGSLQCAIAPSVSALIIGRIIQGAGIGAAACLFRAIMRDTFSGTRLSQVGGIAGMIFWLSPALAPMLGGFIETHYPWRANFYVLLFFIASCLTIAWFFLPETNKQLKPEATQLNVIRKNYIRLIKSRVFMTYVTCASMSFSGLIAYATTSPFIFEESLHLSPIQYGNLAIYITLSAIIGRIINSSIVRRFGIERLMLLGNVIMLIASISSVYLVLLTQLSIMTIMLPTFIFILGSSFVFTNAMAGGFSPFADIAGSASALYGCIQLSVPVIVCSLLALFHAKGALALATVYLIISTISFCVFYLSIWQPMQHQRWCGQ